MEEQAFESGTEKLSTGIKNPFIIAALRGDNNALVWKYIGGTLIILGVIYISASLLATIFAIISHVDIIELAEGKADVDKNALLFVSLMAFLIGDIGIWVVNKFFHRRMFISLITPLTNINWKKIFIAFSLYVLISLLSEGIVYCINPDNYILQFEWSKFLPLLLITCILMPFQTSFEELLFRGYLLQGLGLLFKNTIPAVIITSLLFALMHSWNPEIEQFGFWVMFPYYFGFGLFLGFMTVKDKSLEIALAVHAANNIFSSLFLTFKGSALETDAVFMQKEMNPGAMLPYYFASMFLFLLICTFVFGWWRKEDSMQKV